MNRCLRNNDINSIIVLATLCGAEEYLPCLTAYLYLRECDEHPYHPHHGDKHHRRPISIQHCSSDGCTCTSIYSSPKKHKQHKEYCCKCYCQEKDCHDHHECHDHHDECDIYDDHHCDNNDFECQYPYNDAFQDN